MQAAISGISTIWIVIGVGWLIAHLGLMNTAGRRVMSALAFSVGSPALLFSIISNADIDHLFSPAVVVSVLAVAAVAACYFVVSLLWVRASAGARVVGFMASSYTNAVNFGLPVAIALLGDGTWTAPILLLQVAIIQPVCLVLLDLTNAREARTPIPWGRYFLVPFRNPITVAILLGLMLKLAGVSIPPFVMSPVQLIAGTAVPLMLLAFGVSLRLDPLPGKGSDGLHLWLTVALKVVGHPVLAWAIGRFLFDLDGHALYAVVVLGCLPAAQNVHVVATRYGQSELLARDSVFWSTILSVGSLLMAAALLG